MSVLIVIIVFSILVVIHELGHFIAAKQAGVKVEKFAIGFGPALFKIKGRETEFSVCLFPLGGYVKLAGDSRLEHKGFNNEFFSKAPGVRMRIVFAGPLFNYLLALIIFWIIAMVGFSYPAAVVGKVSEGYPAAQAGVKEGDKILAVNNKNVTTWVDMARIIYTAKEKVNLEVEREGENISIEVPLREKEIIDDFGRKKNISVIGISASSEVEIISYGFFRGFVQGAQALFNLTFLVIKGFVFIILGLIPFKEAMAGPIGIYYITSEAAKIGGTAVLQLMAVLSVSLCIVNLFPIPVLDGGHLFFFFMEKMRKKPLREKTEDILTRVGFTFLILLIIFVFYNDILRFGPKILKNGKNISTKNEEKALP
ncbi:MAG: RIP metalloprotease RseP [Candidatus Omnitrophota bacterium]